MSVPVEQVQATRPSRRVVPAPRRATDAQRPDRATGQIGAPRTEIGQLTGLRFVAALWVLVHHVAFLPVDVYGRWLAPLAPVVAAGPLGVDLFFVLSGFVMARSYLERWEGAPRPRQALDFVLARLARIWPLYALVVSLFGLWCAARAVLGHDGVITWQAAQPGLGPGSWLAQLTMTQMWGSPTLDGVSFVLPTWSVSAEWAAYLAFPVLAVGLWRLRRAPRVVLGVLAVGVAAVPAAAAVVAGVPALIGAPGAAVHPWMLRVGGGFLAGVLTWLVVRRIPATPTVARRAHAVVLAALAEIVLVIYWAAAVPPTAALGAPERLLFAVPVLPVLLGALVLSDRGPARWLAGARMQQGGRLSYALYLVHFPLVEITYAAMTRFPALGPGSSGAALLVPHVLVAAVVLAALAHRVVELPAQRRLRALTARWVRPAGGGRSGAGRDAART